MATAMPDAIFRFHIDNNGETSYFEYKHPVPSFLCQSSPHQQISQQFYDAFIDVLIIVNAQHHDECMSKITAHCAGCGSPAKDALKSPKNLLRLVEPLIIIEITPVCGSKSCEAKVRKQTIEKQNKTLAVAKEEERKVFMKMACNVCKKLDVKRCAGCGQVAYCGAECQKEDWKAHKSICKRRNLKTPAVSADLPYKVI